MHGPGGLVAAGEAQQADLFLARADVVDARAQLQEAEIVLREATLTFEALTGTRPPQAFTEPARGERATGQNPRLTALARAVEVGRASVTLARTSEPPCFSVMPIPASTPALDDGTRRPGS